jgi:hypothetical protein
MTTSPRATRLTITGAFLALALAFSACSGSPGSVNPAATPTLVPSPSPAPTPTPFPIPDDDRLRIPSIDVFAPLTLKIVPRSGQLPEPETPDDVVVYDFRELPGLGGMPGEGTLVLYGQVDSGRKPCKNGTVPPPCAAVGFYFNNLEPGAKVEVYWEKQRYVYTVVSTCSFETTAPNLTNVMTRQPSPSLILLTETGDFSLTTRRYSHMLEVQPRSSHFEGTGMPGGDKAGLDFHLG